MAIRVNRLETSLGSPKGIESGQLGPSKLWLRNDSAMIAVGVDGDRKFSDT